MPPPHDPSRAFTPGVTLEPTRDHDPGPTADPPDTNAYTGESSVPISSNTPPVANGRYVLNAEIARGGMGVIYHATDTVLGRDVAIKVLQDRFVSSLAAAHRFVDEARITAQLQHPAIPPVHDLGTLPDGRPFLAMKLIKGDTLEDLLKASTTPSADRGRLVAAFEQVCQALACAHARNVIHRDLKPANVMVGKFGEVQVMDWGLAKVLGTGPVAPTDPEQTGAGTEIHSLRDSDGTFTQAGSVMGTPAFMPPEQALGAVTQVDTRSDVFGLGGILAAVLTGVPPFEAESAESTRLMAARGKVDECFARLDASDASPELVALCKRCLAPEKGDRPADAGEVARAVAELRAAADERARRAELERVRLEGERATSEARAVERRKRRRLAGVAAVVLALVVVGGLSAVLVVQGQSKDELEIKNKQLADEQVKVVKRYDLALDAIKTLHTGESEEWMLKDERFKPLRDRQLKSAADFYRKLGAMLGSETDFASRRALAQSNFELAELTRKVGRPEDALAAHRSVLDAREALAAEPGADPAVLVDVGRSLTEVASLLRTTDQTKDALATYRRAELLLNESTASHPNARAVLANCRNRLGSLLYSNNDYDGALVALRLARIDQEPLAFAPGASIDARRDLAETVNRLGFILWMLGKFADAEREFRTALAIYTKLAEENREIAEFSQGQGISHFYIGNALHDQGKFAEAEPEFRSAIANLERALKVAPAVLNFRRSLALTGSFFGAMLAENGRLEDARLQFTTSTALLENLIADTGQVRESRETMAEVRSQLGVLYLYMGKPQEAERECFAAEAIYLNLEKEKKLVAVAVLEYAEALDRLGFVLLASGQTAKAKDRYELAIRLAEPVVQQSPKNAEPSLVLVSSLRGYGLTLRYTGEFARAAAEFRRALVLCEELGKRPLCLYEMACCHAGLAGLAGQPGSGVSASEGLGAADEAMKWLSRAVASGYRNRSKFRMEPAFVTLRARPDFQALLMQTEPKASAGSGPKP